MSPVPLQVVTAKHERPNPLRHQQLLSPSLDEVCAQSALPGACDEHGRVDVEMLVLRDTSPT